MWTRKGVYFLSRDLISAHRLNTALTQLELRGVRFPAPYDEPGRLFYQWSHARNYLLDHPVAVTHEDRTYLFLRPAKGGQLLVADTDAFMASERTGWRRVK